jgi:hypothetical protein
MATIPKTGIVTGNAITSTQILNIIEALDGTDATDIAINGVLSLPDIADVSASIAAISSPFTAAGITGSFKGGTQFGTSAPSTISFGRSNQTSSFLAAQNQFISTNGKHTITSGYSTFAGSNFANERFRIDTFSNSSQMRMRGSTPSTTDGASLLSISNFGNYGSVSFQAVNMSTSRPFYFINNSNELSTIAFRGASNVNEFTFFTNNTVTNAAPSTTNGGLQMRGNLELLGQYANKAGTDGWANTSDSRYKESIIDADLDICYNNIKNLKLKKYSYKEEILERPNTDTHTLGWIAQDVETIYPKSVRTSPFTTWVTYNGNTPIYASNGIDIIKPGDRVQDVNAGSTIIPDLKTMTDTQIMNSLYGAVQKLQSTTELLQTQVSSSSATILSQQTRIEALEAQINGEM